MKIAAWLIFFTVFAVTIPFAAVDFANVCQTCSRLVSIMDPKMATHRKNCAKILKVDNLCQRYLGSTHSIVA